MKLVDLNLWIYSSNRDSHQHARAREWVESILSGEETVALAWSVILGFVRVTTRPGAFARPLTPEQAFDVVESWLSRPCVTILSPGDKHWSILRGLLEQTGTAGNLSSDAHLAALALEFGATLCSTDQDFVRFGKQLRFLNPLL